MGNCLRTNRWQSAGSPECNFINWFKTSFFRFFANGMKFKPDFSLFQKQHERNRYNLIKSTPPLNPFSVLDAMVKIEKQKKNPRNFRPPHIKANREPFSLRFIHSKSKCTFFFNSEYYQ